MMGSSRSENSLPQRIYLHFRVGFLLPPPPERFFMVVMSLHCSVGFILCLVLIGYARLNASACIQASRRVRLINRQHLVYKRAEHFTKVVTSQPDGVYRIR